MHWITIEGFDVTTAGGSIYLIDAEHTPCVNRLDGSATEEIAQSQNDDQDEPAETARSGRVKAADICATHARRQRGEHTFQPAW